MSVLEFPKERSVTTPLEIAEDILDRCKRGEIKHLMVVTVDQDERCSSGFSSAPTPYITYMHRVIGLRINDLIRDTRGQ